MQKSQEYANALKRMRSARIQRTAGMMSQKRYDSIKLATYQTIPLHEWNTLTAETHIDKE